jgi:muramidase (phage lysozyme)
MTQTRALLEQWRAQNPTLFNGLKAAIAGPEGTWGKDGVRYNVQYGGGTFNDLSKHPDRVIHGGRYSSAAAGAYQFMPATWARTSQAIGATSFTPEEQDLGMLHLVRERLKPVGGLAALTKAGGLTPELTARLAPEWASLPTLSGQSYYGQPVKPYSVVQDYFRKGASMGGSTLPATATASATPTTTTPAAATVAQSSNPNEVAPGIVINIKSGKDDEKKEEKKEGQSFLSAFIDNMLVNGPDYYAMAMDTDGSYSV